MNPLPECKRCGDPAAINLDHPGLAWFGPYCCTCVLENYGEHYLADLFRWDLEEAGVAA